MRGQESETPKSLPAEGEPSDRLRERRSGPVCQLQVATHLWFSPLNDKQVGAMPMHDYVLAAQTSLRQAADAPFANCAASLGSLIGGLAGTAADYYTAAAVYEQLSRLSDAELQRHGLSRATLGRTSARGRKKLLCTALLGYPAAI